MMASPTRILIINDTEDPLLLLQAVLEAEADTLELASSGAAALAAIAQSPPNLVLLDLAMPDMDGCAVIEQMRQQQEQVIPILLTTAAEPDAIRRALLLGATDWVQMPFEFEELLTKVRTLLHLRANS